MHKVMLAVGCGMGVAADFNVPIGGVDCLLLLSSSSPLPALDLHTVLTPPRHWSKPHTSDRLMAMM